MQKLWAEASRQLRRHCCQGRGPSANLKSLSWKQFLLSCTRIFNSSSNADKEMANKEEPTDLKRTSPVRGILLKSNSKGYIYDNEVGRNGKPEREHIRDNIVPIDGSGASQKHKKKNQLRRYTSTQKVIRMMSQTRNTLTVSIVWGESMHLWSNVRGVTNGGSRNVQISDPTSTKCLASREIFIGIVRF